MNTYQKTTYIVFGLVVVVGILLMITQKISSSRTAHDSVPEEVVTFEDTPRKKFETVPAGTYVFDTQQSMITWTARKKLIANYYDQGTFTVSSGNIVVDEAGNLSAGEIVVNVADIAVTHTGIGGGFDGLARDIVSERFLNQTEFPTASFVVTHTKINWDGTITINGDLLLKGVTVPQTITLTGGMNADGYVEYHGTLDIDRTMFGITFGSDKFFDNLGDKVIDDHVELDIVLVAQSS